MMPNINPKQMQQMMKRMGIQQTEVEAKEVIIKCNDKDIVIKNPQVSKVNMMGQMTWQITGNAEEIKPDNEIEISDEDIATVVQQANCSEKQASEALKKTKGDIAEAILTLKE